MCNLYSMRKSRDELLALFRIAHADEAIQYDLPGIFPDMLAPVVRLDENGARHLTMMRWGFPPPPKGGPRPVTNIRNTMSSYWSNWLKPEFRCLIPATSFCEWTDSRPKIPHWFALDETRPLFAFAGLWRPWLGERKGVGGEHRLYAFLTTDSNNLVRPIHAKAMPVMLCDEEAWDGWLTGSVEEALKLQSPLAPARMGIVGMGAVEDRI
jgi:putative SOS response-associated peptidase YedK